MSNSFKIERLETFVFRAPLKEPVITSFGVMNDRPAVLVRITNANGATGWGEVWCNFPACGAEHRARLVETVIAPLLWDHSFERPEQVFSFLTEKTHVLGIQTGEAGPLAQAIAGIDIAVWDMLSKQNNKPLYAMLSGKTVSHVPVYASGINSDGAVDAIDRCRKESGYSAFKIKIGFGTERDLATINAVRESLQAGETLMLDANQAWDVEAAIEVLSGVENFSPAWQPGWMEEPIRADSPPGDWHAIREATRIPIAGGENVRGEDGFGEAIDETIFDVVQPDACKWGGITQCLKIAGWVLEADLRYCPHYLGGGIGLVASAHILAAAGGDGMLEVDVNPNPLREALAQPFPEISDGRFAMPTALGLGVEPDLVAAGEWLCEQRDVMV